MNLDQILEAILFASARPLTIKYLSDVSREPAEKVKEALNTLRARLLESESGIMLQDNGTSFELATHPETAEQVARVTSEEAAGELTRPSLEALSILAYCGPMTRPELEQIRGVQSSLILRNLMLRGLVEEKEDARLGQPVYSVTFDLLNHLGLPNVESLPDYQELRSHSTVLDVLKDLDDGSGKPAKQEQTL
ncbi:MAG: SMC-Scp complex subunit ScpB [Patescibacteria group bacterium]